MSVFIRTEGIRIPVAVKNQLRTCQRIQADCVADRKAHLGQTIAQVGHGDWRNRLYGSAVYIGNSKRNGIVPRLCVAVGCRLSGGSAAVAEIPFPGRNSGLRLGNRFKDDRVAWNVVRTARPDRFSDSKYTGRLHTYAPLRGPPCFPA